MMLHGTAIGTGAEPIRLAIETQAPDRFMLYVGVGEGDAEHTVRIGPWRTLEKAEEVAQRFATEAVRELNISWHQADLNPAPTRSRGWDPRSMFKSRELSSRRPCPACGGAMHYRATIMTFVTRRRLRVCGS